MYSPFWYRLLPIILIETKPPETTEEFNYILWEEGQLTLNSFNVISTDPDDVVVAETNAGFEEPTYETQIVNTEPCEYAVVNYITKAHFNPELTWIDLEKAEKLGISRVLNHEQRHFDITEIYSRIINQAILESYSKIPCPNMDGISLESDIKEDARIKVVGTEQALQNLVNVAQDYYENETKYEK